MKSATVIKSIAASLIVFAAGAQAEIKIQSAQYNEQKGVVFVKGKTDAATTVYIVNPATSLQLAEVSAAKGQFRKNVVVASGRIPCSIKVQTNSPRAAISWFVIILSKNIFCVPIFVADHVTPAECRCWLMGPDGAAVLPSFEK